MNIFLLLATAAAITPGFHLTTATAPSVCLTAAPTHTGSVVDKLVGDVDIQERNINLVLSKVAYQYHVPIGLEVSAEDDLLKERSITVLVRAGALRDVLDVVISQCPDYAWKVEDDVINVYPKRVNRDVLLETILGLKLKVFSIEEGMGRFAFRQSLMKTFEINGLLKANRISVEDEIFSKLDLAKLGREFSLEASDVSVKSLLNRVVKESETKYWILNRYGENRQYLLLNF